MVEKFRKALATDHRVVYVVVTHAGTRRHTAKIVVLT
jgi:hypothetical protein